MATRQEWGQALQGMGAWFSGRGPEYESARAEQARQAKRDEYLNNEQRRKALVGDLTQMHFFAQNNQWDKAAQLAANRIENIQKLGGDPTYPTAELFAAIQDPARHEEVKAELKSFYDRGVAVGDIKSPAKEAAPKLIQTNSGYATYDHENNRLSPVDMGGMQLPAKEDSLPEPTSRERDWNTYQKLLESDPQSAEMFGRQAGFVSDEGVELSVHLQKRLSDANDRAREARANAVEFDTLASEIEKSNLSGGLFGGTWGERAKDITGSQDAVTRLRQRYMGIRSSMAVKNLPPGVASDKDIELALKGFPTENANKETISSFLRGMSKLESVQDEFETFKADFISSNGTERNLLSQWRERGGKQEIQNNPPGNSPGGGIKFLGFE